MLNIISGNILESSEKYIVHQANCCSLKSAYLARDIFDKFPHANIYSCRELGDKIRHDVPGDIIIRGNGNDQRYVAALLGQYYPGKSKYLNDIVDGKNARQKYFYRSLLKLSEVDNLESIAFPFGIGCGAAGGNISIYMKILEAFADYVGNRKDNAADIFIYKL
ncbi:MAG: macro domain-containing protein [bacterium]|nr:macro domain-containing protein [bacterium]